jgi:hypothetical protein
MQPTRPTRSPREPFQLQRFSCLFAQARARWRGLAPTAQPKASSLPNAFMTPSFAWNIGPEQFRAEGAAFSRLAGSLFGRPAGVQRLHARTVACKRPFNRASLHGSGPRWHQSLERVPTAPIRASRAVLLDRWVEGAYTWGEPPPCRPRKNFAEAHTSDPRGAGTSPAPRGLLSALGGGRATKRAGKR